ncbi:MAG: ROK family protein [Planctomycetes bacterium]|nr:ROK family protein [Planctomycetota bacterium]
MNGTASIAVGIDVGATHVRAGLVTSDGALLALRRAGTPRDERGDALLEWIVAATKELLGAGWGAATEVRSRVRAAGLAVPGLVNRSRGCVVRSVNLPLLEGRPLAAELADRLALPVSLMTDAAAATWGEYTHWRPPVRGFAHLRLGTGVALAVIRNGVLVPMDEGRSTHLPLLVVEHGEGARACRCGLRGCLESVASGAALLADAEQVGWGGGLEALGRALEGGASRARELVDRAATAVAIAVKRITAAYEVDVISLGGGVVDALPPLLGQVFQLVRNRPGEGGSCDPVVVRAGLGDDAGLLGAAGYALRSGMA